MKDDFHDPRLQILEPSIKLAHGFNRSTQIVDIDIKIMGVLYHWQYGFGKM